MRKLIFNEDYAEADRLRALARMNLQLTMERERIAHHKRNQLWLGITMLLCLLIVAIPVILMTAAVARMGK
jgi:hypothetical protein